MVNINIYLPIYLFSAAATVGSGPRGRVGVHDVVSWMGIGVRPRDLDGLSRVLPETGGHSLRVGRYSTRGGAQGDRPAALPRGHEGYESRGRGTRRRVGRAIAH